MLEIVYEDGRPSYFQEKTRGLYELIDAENSASYKQVSKPPDEHSAGLVSNMEAAAEKSVELVEEKVQPRPFTPVSPHLDESEEEKFTGLARTLSYHGVKTEEGELINPFFGSEHHRLVPSLGYSA